MRTKSSSEKSKEITKAKVVGKHSLDSSQMNLISDIKKVTIGVRRKVRTSLLIYDKYLPRTDYYSL